MGWLCAWQGTGDCQTYTKASTIANTADCVSFPQAALSLNTVSLKSLSGFLLVSTLTLGAHQYDYFVWLMQLQSLHIK